MGRKKEIIEITNFTPSSYQEAIFEFIQNEKGNLVIEAAAGAGKSSTIIKALDFIDETKRVLFCAFNKEIVKDLNKKVKHHTNVTVSTVHSVGYKVINDALGGEISTDPLKYSSHIWKNIKYYTSMNLYALGKKNYSRYVDNIIKLVDHCRYNLATTIEDVLPLIERHGLTLLGDEILVVFNILDWGKANLETIDFTDMIWLPHVLDLPMGNNTYDYILFDECQDASIAQRELILKCRKDEDTRYVFVGDKNQSIYSFMSASPDTFDKLKELPNTTCLPLSISYRCAKNIVKFAQNIVPTIEPNDDGRDGEIIKNVKLEDIQDGDMVLCRNNAPLMQVYATFIRMGKRCYIRGRDIGQNLAKLVKNANCEDLNIDLMDDGVFVRLYDQLFKIRDSILVRNGGTIETASSDQAFTNMLDMIRALEVLAEGLETASELIDRINKIFADKHLDGIALSTVHKAKGLEASNVYIACPSLMPSKSAEKDWEIEQERNLMYVAYTRAKNKLGFIDEKGFEKFNTISASILQKIEQTVDYILGRTNIPPTHLIGKGYSGFTASRTKKLTKPTIGRMTTLTNAKQASMPLRPLNTIITKPIRRKKTF